MGGISLIKLSLLSTLQRQEGEQGTFGVRRVWRDMGEGYEESVPPSVFPLTCAVAHVNLFFQDHGMSLLMW